VNSTPTVVVESAEPLSPHGKAVHEAGVALFKESVETGREFCSSMIGTSLTAVPVYVALVQLFVPEGKLLSEVVGKQWLVPVGLFLIAAGVFATGYLPGRAAISLNLPDEVERVLARAINRRFWMGVIGFVALSLGIVASVSVLTCMTLR
jgi:H+/Cl- antiporter ClcA